MPISRGKFIRSNSNEAIFINPVFRMPAKQVFYTPSVYGGAGGWGTRISTSTTQIQYGEGLGAGKLLTGNEKGTMQNLNDRLANYLEKVRSLQQANSKLEVQIRQWHEKNSTPLGRDYRSYYKAIEELQEQIKNAQINNAQLVLQMDNAKLAAEDFRIKYETELGMRLSVENDIQGLNKVTDDLTLKKARLESEIENLTEELVLLRKNHEEEVDTLRKHLGATVKVEVDAAPGPDLGAIINEMRDKYESLAKKNIQKAKERYETQTIELETQITLNNRELETSTTQVKELRRKCQNLEMELQSLLSQRDSLDLTLAETNTRYEARLAQLQAVLKALKDQLIQVRSESEKQRDQFNTLLDVKNRLEQEIITYRRLLEGEDIVTLDSETTTLEERDAKKIRKIRMVVEEVVDGKIVSSKTKEMEETLESGQMISSHTPTANLESLKF
ncbi:keratin, type I cytoskeletal 20 [Ornithorhynchus anatinus]|uniref:Keratin, type I cytoskeletal 20 n=1 Tax=Ornithorhynchus anatinus TaxID=9258 RepID=F7BV03_ORNAN|nr:keratin, type I cytoskeletal 20 [Ornithorhynchus anatinus]